MLSGTSLILLPQTPVVNVSFDLLTADSLIWGWGLIREAERVPAEFIFSKYRVKYCQFENQKFCSWPNYSLLNFS